MNTKLWPKKLDHYIEHLEKDIEKQLIKAEKNKQSILASAFAGKLQDSNEPLVQQGRTMMSAEA